MVKIKRYELRRLKLINGKEPEVFISKEMIDYLYENLRNRDIIGTVCYLYPKNCKEVKSLNGNNNKRRRSFKSCL